MTHLRKSDQDLLTIKELLSPYTKKAYFIGGFVRDSFLGKTTKDIDIEVYDINENLFASLMEKLGAKGVGKSFFVYNWKNYDISLPRTESKTGHGHKGFSVSITNDIEKAVTRRDFTVNSMMMNIFTGALIDLKNGQEDLKNRILRVVNKYTFQEDSLRVLRAVQFAARFRFKIEPETAGICKDITLNDLSKSRVFAEFEKMFTAGFQSYGIYYFSALGIDRKIFSTKIDSKVLCSFIKDVTNALKHTPKSIHKYIFLFFLREYTRLEMDFLLDAIGAPKEYQRFFKRQPKISDVKNRKNLLKLSVSIELERWIGLYKSKMYGFAQNTNLLKKRFIPKITPSVLLTEGFQGKKLGEELERRINREIEEFYEQQMDT